MPQLSLARLALEYSPSDTEYNTCNFLDKHSRSLLFFPLILTLSRCRPSRSFPITVLLRTGLRSVLIHSLLPT